MIQCVLDTNVLLSALLSRQGASFQILERLRQGEWRLALSNHLILEYEEVLQRNAPHLGLGFHDVDALLNSLCLEANCVTLPQPRPPRVSDADDEPLVLLAEASGARLITTHNARHLRPAAAHGILVLLPKEFLTILRENL